MRDIILITALMLTGMAKANACNFDGDSVKAFSTSFIKGTSSFYNLKNSTNSDAKFMLGGCSKTKKKFVQISHGVNHDYIENSTSTTALSDNFVPSICKLVPMPFKSEMTRKEEKAVYLEKLNFINSCFETYVTATNGETLSYPETQIGCEITPISKSKVKYSGNLCYFDIKRSYNFIVELKFKKECTQKEFYKKNKISTQDLVSQLEFNTVNSSDGSGDGIKTVGSTSIRISIDPSSETMITSDDYGRANPLFPGTWVIPDVHFAKPIIESNGSRRSSLFLPFAVDNRCKKTCVDGICSSPCHYSSPVAAEVELYEIPVLKPEPPVTPTCYLTESGEVVCSEIEPPKFLKRNATNKRAEFLKSFYNGGVAQGNWQGIIAGNRIELDDQIQTGKRYRVIAKFRDPKLDYLFLMDLYRSQLGSIPNLRDAQDGVIEGIGGASMDVLSSIGNMLNIANIRSSSSGDSPLSQAIRKFQSLFSYHSWPIYVDRVCDQSLKNCKKPEKKENLQIAMEFTVGQLDEYGEYKLRDIKVSRKSPILKTYKKKISINDFPEIECSYEDEEVQEDEEVKNVI